MDKKLLAKKQALMGLSNKLKEDTRKPMAEELGKKKLSKVTVMAKDEKGLEEGLTKAQQLLKAKFGKLGLDEETMEEVDAEEACPVCEGEGCEECALEETEEEAELE